MIRVFGVTAILACCALAAPAQACQSKFGEAEAKAAQLKRDRKKAQLVAIGEWRPDEKCEDFSHDTCTGRLTVETVERGEATTVVSVRYKTNVSMCEWQVLTLMDAFHGRFHLNHVKKSDDFLIVDLERMESKEPVE